MISIQELFILIPPKPSISEKKKPTPEESNTTTTNDKKQAAEFPSAEECLYCDEETSARCPYSAKPAVPLDAGDRKRKRGSEDVDVAAAAGDGERWKRR
ncbi:MAG: hypothetical protein Q9216_003561 [Gyalolechia sp. 2 TL-2023]